jgi:hypothetical protein
MRAIRQLATLPRLLRAGFALLALGLAADGAYHVAIGGAASHDVTGGPAQLIHLVVAIGMALSLAGIAVTALTRRTTPPSGAEERRRT